MGAEPDESEQPEEPEETLAEVSRIRRRGWRRVHGGAWVAAALLAALVAVSAVLYRHPFVTPHASAFTIPSWAGLPDEQRSAFGSYAYWFVGTPLVFALLAAWYRRRERRVGVRVRWPWVVGIGLGVLVLLAVLAAVPVEPGMRDVPLDVVASRPERPWRAVLSPLLPVAAAVVALGVVERSRWLALAGGWLAAVTVWHSTLGMGGLPPWAVWVLNGGQGPVYGGGQLTLFGLHRPGPVLILAVLPMVGYLVWHAVVSRRAA